MKNIYYTLTFENINDYKYIYDYIDFENVYLIVKHFGEDVKEHYHVISSEWCFGYDGIFQYCKRLENDYDIKKMILYLINGHSKYEIVLEKENFIKKIKEIDDIKFSVDDLLNEIVENIGLNRKKSHSYYLKKYGSIYLKNFRDIRFLFDNTSSFFEF